MSPHENKVPPRYLREARVRAGYANRGTASMRVPFSPETIGRHERGDVEMGPNDIVVYAECYNSPDILPRYCASCPVGKKTGREITERPLPFATLRLRHLAAEAQEVADRLEAIAFDGVIDQSEEEDFCDALEFLRMMEQSISEILLIGLGKWKGRSLVQQGTTFHG